MDYRPTEGGFTLIELLVVIVILAILMAIAIPSYLSQQKKAKDSAAKQYLALAFRSAKADAVATASRFPAAATVVAGLQADQPQLSVAVGAGPTPNVGQVVVDTSSGGDTLILYAHSGSGADWKQTCRYSTGCTVASVSATPTDAHSTISAAPASITGGATTVLTVQARDASGNLIFVGGDTVTISSTVGSVGSVFDNGDGTYTATLTTTPANSGSTATITATRNGQPLANSASVVVN